MAKSDEELNVWEEGGGDLVANHHVGDGSLELHHAGSLHLVFCALRHDLYG